MTAATPTRPGTGSTPDPDLEGEAAPIGVSGEPTGAFAAPVAPPTPVPTRPRWLRLDGRRVSYFDVGEGPVVLCIHGWAHSIHGWRKLVAPLVGAGYRVMAVDLPGFGWSDPPESYTLDGYVGLVAGWLDLHCIDRAALVGNSMGGLIGAAVAHRHPERIEALALVDPAGFGTEMELQLRIAARIGGPIRRLIHWPITRWQVLHALKLIFHDPSLVEPEEVDRILELIRRPGAAEILVDIGRRSGRLRAGYVPAMGLGDVPERVDVPTLVVWGREDRVIPISHLERVRERIPEAEVTIFPACGHAPQLEVPAAFNDRLRRFLDERVERSRQ